MFAELGRPGAIALSVGGGGLLSGVLQGLHKVGWHDVPVLTAETKGACSFASAFGQRQPVTLPAVDTIASTLAARQVCKQAFDWIGKHPLQPWVVDDRATIEACLSFADDHRVLVEPACGAALSAVYQRSDFFDTVDSVLVVVCGGNGVTIDQLNHWRC